MAHIEENNSGGRTTNVDVNIVPFIDLMSVLIIFLLVSAVWTQVSMIQIGSSIYGKKTQDNEAKPPPRAEIPFRVDVKPSGYRVVLGKRVIQIPKEGEGYNKRRLRQELLRLKQEYRDKTDAVITMADELEYGHLIGAMDEVLHAGFPEISIATGGAQ